MRPFKIQLTLGLLLACVLFSCKEGGKTQLQKKLLSNWLQKPLQARELSSG